MAMAARSCARAASSAEPYRPMNTRLRLRPPVPAGAAPGCASAPAAHPTSTSHRSLRRFTPRQRGCVGRAQGGWAGRSGGWPTKCELKRPAAENATQRGLLAMQALTFWQMARVSGDPSRDAQPSDPSLPRLVPSLALSASSDCARPAAAAAAAATAAGAGAGPSRPISAPFSPLSALLGPREPRRRLEARSGASLATGAARAGSSALRRLPISEDSCSKAWKRRIQVHALLLRLLSSSPQPELLATRAIRVLSTIHKRYKQPYRPSVATTWLPVARLAPLRRL